VANSVAVVEARAIKSASFEMDNRCKPLQISTRNIAASMAATPKLVFRLNDTGDSFDGGVLTQFVLPYMMGEAAIFRKKSFFGSLYWIGVR
jgi:hypothetical protein